MVKPSSPLLAAPHRTESPRTCGRTREREATESGSKARHSGGPRRTRTAGVQFAYNTRPLFGRLRERFSCVGIGQRVRPRQRLDPKWCDASTARPGFGQDIFAPERVSFGDRDERNHERYRQDEQDDEKRGGNRDRCSSYPVGPRPAPRHPFLLPTRCRLASLPVKFGKARASVLDINDHAGMPASFGQDRRAKRSTMRIQPNLLALSISPASSIAPPAQKSTFAAGAPGASQVRPPLVVLAVAADACGTRIGDRKRGVGEIIGCAKLPDRVGVSEVDREVRNAAFQKQQPGIIGGSSYAAILGNGPCGRMRHNLRAGHADPCAKEIDRGGQSVAWQRPGQGRGGGTRGDCDQ